MSRRALLMLTAIALLCAFGVAVYSDQQPARTKPVREERIHTSGGAGAPETLEALFAMSPLVVDATVLESRPVDRVLPSADPANETLIVQTAHALKINEVFRSVRPQPQGRRIEVLQLGGERDRGDYIESVIDETFPPLQKGARYLLFLTPYAPSDGMFTLATGTSDSVLRLENDATIKTNGRSNLARQLERYSHGELINVLRNLRESGR